MKQTYTLIILLLIFSQACVFRTVNKQYDDFENQVKFKLKQTYLAKNEFKGRQHVTIQYYKTISSSSKKSITAKLYFSSLPEHGKLNNRLKIKTETNFHNITFYDIETREIIESEVKTEHVITENTDSDDKDNNTTETYTSTITNSTEIANLVYFDISNDLAKEILNSEELSFRFYLGNEAITINFSKKKLKKLKKLLQAS